MSTGPTLPGRSDVVVVGGGIVGTSAAYFLATETDRDVTLVEKGAIASGSTGDSSAILRHHYGPQEQYSRMAWWSHQFYRRFEAETGEVIAHEDNPLVRFGVEGEPSGDYAEAGYDVLSSLDVPVSRYDREEAEEQYPMLGFDEYDFAVSDDAASYSDGTDAANGFARAAAREGATVVTGVEVEEIAAADGAVAGVETSDGRVDCDDAVLAAGPWTPRLAETVGVEVPVTVTREQVVVLDPPEEYAETYPDLTPTTALPGGEWYVRPDFGGGILVATHHTGDEVDPDTYDRKPDEETLLDLVGALDEVLPGLGDAEIAGRYCGVYSTTPDHDFVVDQVGPEGCYLACGFSGHGFKHGPAVGKMLTDLLTRGDTDMADAAFFSLDRFDDDPAGHGLPEDLA
ncbi:MULTISPECIES: FAD-binding oxidoreductase [Halorussus]|uniref:NAD(P)/FAD-dependent oxidoreductase n=1 Tax=Halorussus TaxID=1070314 RepID=UPI000E21866A|nr:MULTISPECIES: FAD-binding oxidoreductase [Halorussus]NHN58481.1 FAD-binding oxidoreductase [Halorussus sp. JP-T4]